MRAAILILIVLILGVIAAIATGFLNVSQVREARAPQVSASTNGVTAQGGQAPAFDVQTGSVKIGTANANVKVPALEVNRPGAQAQQDQQQQQVANNAM